MGILQIHFSLLAAHYGKQFKNADRGGLLRIRGLYMHISIYIYIYTKCLYDVLGSPLSKVTLNDSVPGTDTATADP